MACKTSLI